MLAIALVDYDNCRLVLHERGAQDVEYNLSSIAQAVADICRQVLPAAVELRLRLYGGWIAQDGYYTARADMLLRNIGAVRGMSKGLRIVPELATGLARYCSERIVGLVRTDRTPPQQKMVDTLITVDALHVSRESPILIVSDDDDLVPGAIGAAASGGMPVYLIRRRVEGRGLNDSLCIRVGVNLGSLPKEYQNGS